MNQALPKQNSKENNPEGKESRSQSKRIAPTEALDEVKIKSTLTSSNLPSNLTKVPTKMTTPSKNNLAPEITAEGGHTKENHDEATANQIPELTAEEKAELERNNKAAEQLQKYLQSTGISLAFQLIFSEIVQKKIPSDKVFGYASHRLKQIGADLQELKAQKI